MDSETPTDIEMLPLREESSPKISITASEGEALAAEPSAKAKGKQRATDQGATASDFDTISSSIRPVETSTSTAGKAASLHRASWIPAKSWVHFVAGGLGGMCGALVTQPFDVAKTRLQSSLFSAGSLAAVSSSMSSANKSVATSRLSGAILIRRRGVLYHFVDTGVMLRDIQRKEGFRALFRGLGPTLVGVIPARSINFFAYGNGKQMYARLLNGGQESAGIHLVSAATAGIITGTITNPIWVVKTRLQLQESSMKSRRKSPVPTFLNTKNASRHASSIASAVSGQNHLFITSYARAASVAASVQRPNGQNSLECIAQIWRHEGLKGFYRGLSASYLGVAEGTIQWTLYEQFKSYRSRHGLRREEGWLDKVGAAGAAKLIATIITYPHEVARTRLRQAPLEGQSKPKYHGLVQTFRLVLAEEGAVALYGGLAPHLLRVVPNAAVMYTVYELVLKYGVA